MSNGKVALISGVTGQDGSYLAKLLIEKGYAVVGLTRLNSPSTLYNHASLGIQNKVELVSWDPLDLHGIYRIIERYSPDEIYHLAGQSSPQASFEHPTHTFISVGLATLRLLEAVRLTEQKPRFYHASSSEIFGAAIDKKQNENSPLKPRSPYGVAKLYAHWTVKNHREAYGLHASSGILFSHESPLRSENFVTRKISLGLVALAKGSGSPVLLGNLDNRRDWGFAGDYVEAMWLVTQNKVGEDFVIGSGSLHSVRDFAVLAANCLGFEVEWVGKDENEKGIDKKTGEILFKVSRDFFRPSEPDPLIADTQKAKQVLGWQPKKKFAQVVEMMVEHDLSNREN